MKTLKMFAKLLVIFVAFYIFSEVVSREYLRSTYSSLERIEIVEQTPKIEVEESKATKVDGYIEGRVINTANDNTANKYIKVDCFSKYNNYLGSEYAKIGNLANGESNRFKVKYNFNDVENVKVSVTDEAPESTEMKFRKLNKVEKAAVIAGSLIVTYYLPARFLFGIFPV